MTTFTTSGSAVYFTTTDAGATFAVSSTAATFDVSGVGPSGTLAVGTVTTGAPGGTAVVTNVGSSTAAVLNFTIPAGQDGAGTRLYLNANYS